jgi:hypothetical protein
MAISKAQEARDAFVCDSFWIGMAIIFASATPLITLGMIQHEAYLIAYLEIFHVRVMMSRPFGLLLTYFGPPSWLTLGCKIGGFAPTSCEVSRVIAGHNAWPCQALRFKSWLFCLGDRECRSLPERLWVEYFYLASCTPYLIIITADYPRRLDRRDERRRQERRLRLHGVRWDVEHDFALGIVRGYRGIRRGIARGNKEWGAGARTMNVKAGLYHT